MKLDLAAGVEVQISLGWDNLVEVACLVRQVCNVRFNH